MVGRPRALAALCAAAVLGGGCGGDDGPTRAEFARQADEVCKPALAELRAITKAIEEVSMQPDSEAIFKGTAAEVAKSATVSRRAFDRIDALEPPPDDADAVKGWIADNRRQITMIDELGAAFEASDEKRISELSGEIDELNAQNNAFAKDYGMKVCSADV